MNRAVLLLLCVWIACAYGLKMDSSFEEWEEKYQKSYSSEMERQERRVHFENTRLKVLALKTQFPSFPIGLSALADRSESELQRMRMPYKTSAYEMPCKVDGGFPSSPPTVYNASAIHALPESFHWKDHTPTPLVPVRNQGSVGTCYAFSSLDCLSGALSLHRKEAAVPLSVEQIVDCSPAFDCGVFGGWPCRTLQHTMVTGVETEEQYPYCVGNGACYPCPPSDYNVSFCGPPPSYCNRTAYPCRYNKALATNKPTGWHRLSDDEDQLRATLFHEGPISVLLNAELLSFYVGGIWDPPFCDPKSLDHAVLLVGYGTESTTFGTYPYWWVQNSWSDSFGYKGYFKIVRGKNTCGIESAAVNAFI